MDYNDRVEVFGRAQAFFYIFYLKPAVFSPSKYGKELRPFQLNIHYEICNFIFFMFLKTKFEDLYLRDFI